MHLLSLLSYLLSAVLFFKDINPERIGEYIVPDHCRRDVFGVEYRNIFRKALLKPDVTFIVPPIH